MKYVRDNTGRFVQRPYYDAEELDHECEQIVKRFMVERYGGILFPIPTDAFTKLIETDADDLDLYADLSREGRDVEGMTEFYPPGKPKVKVTKELSEDVRREHRLRTTLTHEYGHVKFHAWLWDLELAAPSKLPGFDGSEIGDRNLATNRVQRCKRQTILDAPANDWMEWQAGYICGALLMPKTELKRIASAYLEKQGLTASLKMSPMCGVELQRQVADYFNVSMDAAAVRLEKMGYLRVGEGSKAMF